MDPVQTLKKNLLVNQSSTATNATAVATLDCAGQAKVMIDVLMGTVAAVTNVPATLRLLECDNTSPTNFAAITEFTGGTASGNFTLPNWVTAATQISGPYVTMAVDMRKRKRYLRLEVTPVTDANTITELAQLYGHEQVPITAAGVNSAALVIG